MQFHEGLLEILTVESSTATTIPLNKDPAKHISDQHDERKSHGDIECTGITQTTEFKRICHVTIPSAHIEPLKSKKHSPNDPRNPANRLNEERAHRNQRPLRIRTPKTLLETCSPLRLRLVHQQQLNTRNQAVNIKSASVQSSSVLLCLPDSPLRDEEVRTLGEEKQYSETDCSKDPLHGK